MRVQWPAVAFWVTLAAAIAAGWAYWNSRPVPASVPVPVLDRMDDATQGQPGPDTEVVTQQKIPGEALSPEPLAPPVAISVPAPKRVIPRHRRVHREPRPDIQRPRVQRRSSFCSRIPAIAYQVDRATIISAMQSRGASTKSINEVLACVGK